MQENYKKILAADVKVLEYWRRRYLGQTAVVLIFAGVLVTMVLKYIADIRLWVLLLPLIALVSFVMIKELREALQTKGENLIFTKAKTLFDDIRFDYAAGIDDKFPIWENWNYNLRDCRAVVLGEGFCLEEDCLYHVTSFKFIEIKGTVFRGILLSLDCHESAQSLLNDARFKQEAERLRQILKAEKFSLSFMQNKICLCFVSNRRLYHQFSLLRFNLLTTFICKLEMVLAQVLALQALLSIDKENS